MPGRTITRDEYFKVKDKRFYAFYPSQIDYAYMIKRSDFEAFSSFHQTSVNPTAIGLRFLHVPSAHYKAWVVIMSYLMDDPKWRKFDVSGHFLHMLISTQFTPLCFWRLEESYRTMIHEYLEDRTPVRPDWAERGEAGEIYKERGDKLLWHHWQDLCIAWVIYISGAYSTVNWEMAFRGLISIKRIKAMMTSIPDEAPHGIKVTGLSYATNYIHMGVDGGRCESIPSMTFPTTWGSSHRLTTYATKPWNSVTFKNLTRGGKVGYKWVSGVGHEITLPARVGTAIFNFYNTYDPQLSRWRILLSQRINILHGPDPPHIIPFCPMLLLFPPLFRSTFTSLPRELAHIATLTKWRDQS